MARGRKKADGSTEEKIKQAARKLFTEKGYEAVKTRDIAAEAGINLALLNYYFRSKENLFNIIMAENFRQFMQQLAPVMSNEKNSIDLILEKMAVSYIDMLTKNPDLPSFIINSLKSGTTPLTDIDENTIAARGQFIKKVKGAMESGEITQMHIAHFMVNFMSLVIFPFASKPILMRITGINQKEFDRLMEERKKLIPVWIKALIHSK